MTGGHGAFGPLMESSGLQGGITISLACATFGLVSGSIIGGPLAKKLVEKNKLTPDEEVIEDNYLSEANAEGDSAYVEVSSKLAEKNLAKSATLIIIAMGIGTIVSELFNIAGVTMPAYIGAMIVAAIIRNIFDANKNLDTPSDELSSVGSVCLSLFLSMAICSLKLWELIDLAIPIIIILAIQTLLMIVFAYFITFRIMGKDYTAAVLSAGHCGFGMGATPNGIANMQSVTEKYGASPSAFFILPLVGALFIEFFNSAVVTTFMNFL